ncbi:protein adenylyltransferase SelO family protein [Klebsiella pneumoniae]|nr:protein adenylyltransferase SelO family protein [Klebsiella pneumoniae]
MGDGRAVPLDDPGKSGVGGDARSGGSRRRALAMVTSDTPVYRERVEPGAMLMRVAGNHVRFGHSNILLSP